MRAHVDMEWPVPPEEGPDQGLDTRETAGALRSWLVRGTHKVAIHPRRRTGKHREARELLATDAGWLPGDRSGWRGLVSALQRHSVLHALALLRKGDREILTMAYLEGHTNEEIGRMLRVSARTVSRRLAAALSQLEEHARNVGIWLAAFALVALGVVSRPGATVAGALRSDRWTLVAAVGTATVVTAASIAAVATAPESPLTRPSTFAPAARSVNAAPVTFVNTDDIPSSPVTVVAPPIAPADPTATHKTKPAHDPATQTTPTTPTTHGCGGKPTDAPPVTPVGPRGPGPHTSPVTHPGPGGCGPHAGKTVPSGH